MIGMWLLKLTNPEILEAKSYIKQLGVMPSL
jgi:hypothetical protein